MFICFECLISTMVTNHHHVEAMDRGEGKEGHIGAVALLSCWLVAIPFYLKAACVPYSINNKLLRFDSSVI